MLETLKTTNIMHQTNFAQYTTDIKINNFYYGIDPNTHFIHLGHIVNLIMAKVIYEYIPQFIIVMGTFTARIGDPTGKKQSRENIQCDNHNTKIIEYSLNTVAHNLNMKPIILHNDKWLNMPLYKFFDIARHFNTKHIYNSAIFKTRINANNPIYMHELLYPILQAYDYLYLYENYGCSLQIGGQDQWTNILAGSGLIRSIKNVSTYAITCKLLTDANNNKIGKSEKNAVQLSSYNNCFITFNTCINIPDYIREQITSILNTKYNYIEFAAYICSLLHHSVLYKELVTLYNNIQNNKLYDTNLNIEVLKAHIPTYYVTNSVSIKFLAKQCIHNITNKTFNMLIQKQCIQLNNQVVNCIHISIEMLTHINILQIKNSVLLFYVKHKKIDKTIS